MFLQIARTPDLWANIRTHGAPQRRVRAKYSMTTHIVCVLRILLLLPFALCIVVAWIAATALAAGWIVLAAPLPTRDSTLLD